MTTNNFFNINKDTFDIIFIDADHNFNQVKIDFENSLKILNEFGIIILHDTDPIDRRLLNNTYCSDSYKIVDYIYKNHPELDIITLPIHETGMSLVMRKNDRRINYI
jgi:predicted O-methyltransferase YrrM